MLRVASAAMLLVAALETVQKMFCLTPAKGTQLPGEQRALLAGCLPVQGCRGGSRALPCAICGPLLPTLFENEISRSSF